MTTPQHFSSAAPDSALSSAIGGSGRGEITLIVRLTSHSGEQDET